MKLGNPGEAFVEVRSTLQFVDSYLTTALTLTDQLQAAAFLANSSTHIHRVDLTHMAQVRVVGRVTSLGGGSANNPRLVLKYRTAFSTTVGDYADIGTSEVAMLINATGVNASGWVDLAAGAKADVFVAMTSIGGDGVADPVVGHLQAQYRDWTE